MVLNGTDWACAGQGTVLQLLNALTGFLSSLIDQQQLSHEESGEKHLLGSLNPFLWILAFDISGKTS